jgi:rhodanese-related sulfurtransferase
MNARLAAVAILVAALVFGAAALRAEPVMVATPDEVRSMIDQGAKIVDIRRPEEWRETGVIEGSILLTAVDADGRLVAGFPQALGAAVGRDDPVIVICRSGNRSAAVGRMMSESGGFSRVVDAGGGIRAWLGAGQAVAPCPSC